MKQNLRLNSSYTSFCSRRRPRLLAGVLIDHPVKESRTEQPMNRKPVDNGKVFITRHGERADLADEQWLAQAEARVELVGVHSVLD